MIKVFILISPFAILSLSQKSTSWFFKSWIRNFFSMLFIQIIVALVLLILFSMDYSSTNLLTKFLYIGGIYALIRANSFVKEFIGGISTDVKANVGNYLRMSK
jgi:type IV secretory pathway VirB6-like protein